MNMNFLKKKDRPSENIAFIAIMAAINLIFVTISNFLPILFLLLVFILPLTSLLVALSCKKMYIPIYFVTTILLCLAVNFGFGLFDTFIYVIPSLITGILFGILINKKVPAIIILIVNVVIQFGLTYLTFFIIDNFITGINFYNSLFTLFGLQEFPYTGILTIIFTYIIALIQISLTYLIVKYALGRLEIEFNLELNNRLWVYIPILIALILMILSLFYFSDWSILFTLIVVPLIIYEFIELVMSKRIWIYVGLTISLLVFVFIFAFLYQYIPVPNSVVLIYIFFVLVTILDILFNYCFKLKGKKIE